MSDVQVPDAFGLLVEALEPWLDQVVIVGGWAHDLYRLHPDAQRLHYPALSTLDADIGLPAILPPRAQDIRARLMDRGFTEEFLGDDRPPATHYRLGGETSGFYVEFLTPLVGSEYNRRQRRKATVEIAGVASQALRYIEVLLDHPSSIHLQYRGVISRIQIANPVSFLVQKVLIHRKREREDRAKDILYMHDTLEVFGASLAEMSTMWHKIVAPKLHARNARTVSAAAEILFGRISDDVRRAAEISAERALSPDAVRVTCQYGFTKVFGRIEPQP